MFKKSLLVTFMLLPLSLFAPPVGLKNVGSSCFMAAAAQALLSMEDLIALLSEKEDYYYEESLSESFRRLFIEKAALSSINPLPFFDRGWKSIDSSRGKPDDSLFFLGKLLHGISESDISKPFYESLPQISSSTKRNEFTQLFFSTIKNDYYLHGNLIATKTYETPLITLPVMQHLDSLPKCIKELFKDEPERLLIGERALPTLKKSHFEETQTYIFFGFDRKMHVESKGKMAPKFSKSQNLITFPYKNLDLSDLYAEKYKNKGMYDLKALIMHSGDANSGHYTSYVRYGAEWFYCDDGKITKIAEQDIMAVAARGYGLNKTILPDCLVYELASAR